MELNDNLQKYYDYLKGAKADVPPTFDSFQKTLSDEKSAKQYYDYLRSNKFDAPDTYESFSKTLGLKKKDATDYGLPTHEAFANVLSKVAGDIPKIDASNKVKNPSQGQDQAQPEEPIQYPHWTNVSKALGIDLPLTTENPKNIGEPEYVGGKKPTPSLKDIEEGNLIGENVQPTSKPTDIFIQDKIPTRMPRPESDYLDALSRGIYNETANLIRNIGYMAVDLPQKIKTAGTETIVKTATKISGIDSETTKKYASKIAEAINNGFYGGNTASLMKEGYEKTADFLDKTLVSMLKATPEDKWGFGKALESTGGFSIDLLSMGIIPVAKAPLLVEYGLQGMLKMPEYFGLKSYIEGMRGGKPTKEVIAQSAESAGQAMAYNSVGVWSGEMGQIAKSMGAGLWTSEATKLFANSLGFAGIGKPEDVMQNLTMGAAFYGLSAPEALKEMVNKKAMLGYMTATNNNIRMVSEMKMDPFEARKESFELFIEAQQETDPARKAELLHQKTIVDNAIDINAMTNNILKNPDAFIKSIQDNDLLSAREKKIWTNKIRTTIEETDPRKKEAAPVVENIDRMQKDLNDAKNDENTNPTEKEAKVNGLQKKIDEEKKVAEKIFGKSVDDYNELKPENKQRDLEMIAKEVVDKTQKEKEEKAKEPTEIAKKNGLEYQGQWKDENGKPTHDEYKDKETGANFTVPIGSDESKVLAEKDKTVKPIKEKKPEEWESWDKKTFQENLIKASTGKNKKLSDQVEKATKAHPEWGKFKTDISKVESEERKTPEPKPKVEGEKKGKPFGRSLRLANAKDRTPDNITDVIMQHFMRGGKVNRKQFINESGWSEGDIEESGVGKFLEEGGRAFDTFHENEVNTFGVEEKGAMDMGNEIVKVLTSYADKRGKVNIWTLLDAFEKRHNIEQPFEPTEEEIAKQEQDEQLTNIIKKNGGLNGQAIEEAANAGLISKDELDDFKNELRNENAEQEQSEREWAEEQAQIESKGGGKEVPPSEKPSTGKEEKPSVRLWKDEKDTPESVRARFGIADQEFTPEDVDNIPSTLLWEQNGHNIIGVDDSYMKTHFYSNWAEGGNSAIYPEWNPHGDIHVANNVADEYKSFVAAHEIWEEYKVEKKGLKYSSAQGSAHEQSNKMEIPLRRFYDEQLKPKGGKVLSINVTDEGFNFKYKETADGPEKEATMFPDGTMEDGKHGNDLGTDIKPNEEPINKPSAPAGKGEENKLPGGTETNKGPAAPKGEEKPVKYTPEQQKQVDAINKDYNKQIADRQKELDNIPDQKKKAKLEADGRNQIFGDPNAKPSDLIKPEDQGFKVTPETIEAVGKKFDERASQLTKEIADLEKERDSKIGEVTKQQELFSEEKPPEKPEINQGIEFKGKFYIDVDEVQDAFGKGEITLDEQKPLIEKVREFEKGLKSEATKRSNEMGKTIGATSKEAEDRMKDELGEKKGGKSDDGKLFMRILPPDLISRGQTVLYKAWLPVHDALSDAITKKLQAGMKSQIDLIRWPTKILTNWWGGLGRTFVDIHGKEGKPGKLAMTGTVKTFAPFEAKEIYGKLSAIIGGDHESNRRTLDVLDPDPKFATQKLNYGDLSVAEKNYYWAIRDWNTWVHETNYAKGFISTETYLKFKDPLTKQVTYIARMYDKYEEDPLTNPEIQEFINRGNSAVTGKMNTGYMKLRQEADDWKKEHAIRDPAYLTAKRVMETIQNTAIKDYMDLMTQEHPDWVLDLKKGQELPKGFTQLSNSYSWGPFRGKAVINHLVEDFTGFYYANGIINAAYDFFKMVDRTKFNQFYKKLRTVYSPMVQVGNITGDIFFASINGLNPVQFLSKSYAAWTLYHKNPLLFKQLMKDGLIGNFGMAGELKPLDVLTNKKTGFLSQADELATKAYIGADNLAKIAAYLNFRDQGMSHAASVRRAYDAFQNYSTVGKTWDVASKIPVVGPSFAKFQADLQRILINGATTTPLTLIGTLMLIKAGGMLASALSGETKEEQQIRENRKGVAKIPIVNIPLSFKVGKSELNVARYLSPLYNYNYSDSEMQLDDISKYLPIQFQKVNRPILGEKTYLPAFADATWGWIGSVVFDRDFRGMSIRNPTATEFSNPNHPMDNRILNVMNYIGRTQVPFYKGAQDMYDGISGNLDYYGRKRDWKQAILNNIIKIQEFDKPQIKNNIERNIEYLTNRFTALSARMGDANKEFLTTLKKAEAQGVSDEGMVKIYKVADRLRSKSLQKSLDEQIPVMKELEEKVGIYKKMNPDDPFIQENFKNVEEGKSRRFNVLDNIDLQKNYPKEFNLLKSNDLIKTPVIPKYYMGEEVTDAEKKEYANIYWREYLQNLDSFVGLTPEEFDEAKKVTMEKPPTITSEGNKEQSLLQIQASEAARLASETAKMLFRNQ
jgi:hypothetical protein